MTSPPVLHSRLLVMAGSSPQALHLLESAERVWQHNPDRWPAQRLYQAFFAWHEWQDRYERFRSTPGSSRDADMKLLAALVRLLRHREACPVCIADPVAVDVTVDDVEPVEAGGLACADHRLAFCQRCLRLGLIVEAPWVRDGDGYCDDCQEAARRRALHP